MAKYVALLRGINVGGKTVPMKRLTEVFKKLGFENIKTLLASGNVVFESSSSSIPKIVSDIEKAIEKEFGFSVSTQVRKHADIQKLITSSPFPTGKADSDTHWYVTFLNKPDASLPTIKSEFFKFLSIRDGVLYSALYRNSGKTTDFMTILDKQFGKGVTTRNWNTILKIGAL